MHTDMGLNQHQKKGYLKWFFSFNIMYYLQNNYCLPTWSNATSPFCLHLWPCPEQMSSLCTFQEMEALQEIFYKHNTFFLWDKTWWTHSRVTSWEVDYCCLTFNRSWIRGSVDGFSHWLEWPLQLITAGSLPSPAQLLGSALGQVASNQDTVKHEVMIITENEWGKERIFLISKSENIITWLMLGSLLILFSFRHISTGNWEPNNNKSILLFPTVIRH